MKCATCRTVVGFTIALAIAIMSGCDDGDDSDAGGAKPANISGTWVGQQTSSVATYPVNMTLTQKGSNVSGTYVKGRSTAMNPQPDTRLSISGTYDSSTGIFNCNGWWIITFIDDNTMTWKTDPGNTPYTTILYRQ